MGLPKKLWGAFSNLLGKDKEANSSPQVKQEEKNMEQLITEIKQLINKLPDRDEAEGLSKALADGKLYKLEEKLEGKNNNISKNIAKKLAALQKSQNSLKAQLQKISKNKRTRIKIAKALIQKMLDALTQEEGKNLSRFLSDDENIKSLDLGQKVTYKTNANFFNNFLKANNLDSVNDFICKLKNTSSIKIWFEELEENFNNTLKNAKDVTFTANKFTNKTVSGLKGFESILNYYFININEWPSSKKGTTVYKILKSIKNREHIHVNGNEFYDICLEKYNDKYPPVILNTGSETNLYGDMPIDKQPVIAKRPVPPAYN